MKRYCTQLVRFLATEHRRSQLYYRTALADITRGIADQRAQGHSVHLIGFGTFYTRLKPTGKLKALRNGKFITYSARQQPAFHAGDQLRAAIQRAFATKGKVKPGRKGHK